MTATKFDLGIRCDWAVPMVDGNPEVQENFFIGIRKSEIVEARTFKNSDKKLCKKFLNKKNMVAIPGLINGHSHLAMTLLRGCAEDMKLENWLFNRIFPLEKALVDKEFVKWGTTLAALECIRFGTTTVNDHYFFVDEASKVWNAAGLRGTFHQVFLDFPIPDSPHASHSESLFWKHLEKYKNHPRIQIGIGPHAPYSCSDELLRKCAEIAEKSQVPVHIHLSESISEAPNSIRDFSMLPTQRLQKVGLLGPRTVCAHSIHVSDAEIEILRQTETSVVHNPDCNAKLSSGVAPLPKYFKAGVPVGLGTDGAASNNDMSLFGAMDVGGKIQKLYNADPTCVTAGDLLRCATWEGARAIGRGHQIGSLEPGKLADIAIVNFAYPHLQPVNDIVSHLVFSCQGLEVDTVVCHGKILREGDKWYTLRSTPVFAFAEKFRRRLHDELDRLEPF